MNNLTVAGTIGKDAELRTTPKGEQVLSFSIADSQGKDKPTIWWSAQLWGRRAESLAPYLLKGTSVTVTGSVSQRTYTDKQGVEKTATELRVNDLALQGSRIQESAAKPAQKPSTPASSGHAEMPDEEIPFADPMKSRAYCLAV